MVASGLLPMVHWCAVTPSDHVKRFLGRLLMMFGLYGLGALLWKTHVPECFFPGRFDHWLHSHQLWHLCIIAAAYAWYDDLLEYYQVVRAGSCVS